MKWLINLIRKAKINKLQAEFVELAQKQEVIERDYTLFNTDDYLYYPEWIRNDKRMNELRNQIERLQEEGK